MGKLQKTLALLVLALLLTACGGSGGNRQNDADTPTTATPRAAAGSRRTVINETQSFNIDFVGHMEVTLNYVEFVDRIVTSLFGTDFDHEPDEGQTFLRADLTIQNIGTTQGLVLTAWNTVIYDGVFEFTQIIQDGVFQLNPLTPPASASIAFMIPNRVEESDGPLVLNFGDGSIGGSVMAFTLRGDADEPATAADTSGQAQATAADEQLIGVWLQDLDDYAPDWLTLIRGFYADGTGYWWGDGPGQTFTWRADNDMVTLVVTCEAFGDEWTEIYQFEIVGDVLTLTHEDGWQIFYVRAAEDTTRERLVGSWAAHESGATVTFDFLENGRAVVQIIVDGTVVDTEMAEWYAGQSFDNVTGWISISELDGTHLNSLFFEFVSDNHLLLDFFDGEPPVLFIRQ